MSQTTIIETNDGRMFSVADVAAGTPAAFMARAVKRVAGGFAPKAKARETLIRRACCRVVRSAAA